MFINISNHPSSDWGIEQISKAKEYGEIVDLPFPEIDPTWNQFKIFELCNEYFSTLKEIQTAYNSNVVVHLMGEYCFCYNLVNLLKEEGVEVVVSTSERKSKINEDGSKTIQFDFVQFRKYF